jgi:hypothetical protein
MQKIPLGFAVSPFKKGEQKMGTDFFIAFSIEKVKHNTKIKVRFIISLKNNVGSKCDSMRIRTSKNC